MHSTSNLEDGYMGSGKNLWNSIRKYGKENFKFEIIEWYSDRTSLRDREVLLVNEDLLKDPLCMNLQTGGTGWMYAENHPNFGKHRVVSEETRHRISLIQKGRKRSEEFKKKISTSKKGHIVSEESRLKSSLKQKGINRHTEEAKHRISLAQKGRIKSEEEIEKIRKGIKGRKSEQCSGFGTVWINDKISNKKVKKDNLEHWLNIGWIKGRIWRKKRS